jgi:hypothetical protein
MLLGEFGAFLLQAFDQRLLFRLFGLCGTVALLPGKAHMGSAELGAFGLERFFSR